MILLAQLDLMTSADQWGWVAWAYGFTVVALVTYAGSIAVRLSRSRRRLDQRP